MANDVFANGREISCKKADGKSICAFPDVCFTPPENPATPPGVPVPYPNTGMAKDTTSGSKSVKISDKEVLLKNKSYYKKSMGDEAGSAAKKGIITSVNRGKVYFTSWSMDVKIEGYNVARHMDLSTHNHASPICNTPPWLYTDSVAMASISEECKEQIDDFNECREQAIKDSTHKKHRRAAAKPDKTKIAAETDNDAVDWSKIPQDEDFYDKKNATKRCCDCCDGKESKTECVLVTYDWGCCDDGSGTTKTAHHIIPIKDHHKDDVVGAKRGDKSALRTGCENYDDQKAPCICVDGHDHGAEESPGKLKQHGRIGRAYAVMRNNKDGDTYQYKDVADEAAQITAHHAGCDKACIKAQMDAYHNDKSSGPLKKSQQAKEGGEEYLKEAIPPAQQSTGLGT
jgi:hypothetical protein